MPKNGAKQRPPNMLTVCTEQVAVRTLLKGASLTTGCKCRQCFGLREYMQALTGKDFNLPAAEGHPDEEPVSVVVQPCDGTMTCECPKCEASRTKARERRPVRQPWEPRQAA